MISQKVQNINKNPSYKSDWCVQLLFLLFSLCGEHKPLQGVLPAAEWNRQLQLQSQYYFLMTFLILLTGREMHQDNYLKTEKLLSFKHRITCKFLIVVTDKIERSKRWWWLESLVAKHEPNTRNSR